MVCCTDNATAKQCIAQELIKLTPWSDRSINTCSAHGLTWLWTIMMAVGICSSARWAGVCAKQPQNVQSTRASDLHLHEANMLQSKCVVCSL